MLKYPIAALAASVAAIPALAHHGFGRFDGSAMMEAEGTLTGIDFVNPHAYMYFDAVQADGTVLPMRCEMRAATVLRRSGWSEEMFQPGLHVRIEGNPHRDDPASCYIETLELGERTFERYQQLSDAAPVVTANRPARLASGELNLSGDWAQEQYLIARAPPPPPGSAPGGRRGGGGGLVPKSMVAGIEAGTISMADVPPSGWGGARVTYTEAGQAASAAVAAIPPSENLRAKCEITSILFDWVFDGAVNRIAQERDRIVVNYGLYSFERVIHMDLAEHPTDLEPSYAGHSIGRWDGDVLVVDTVGFEPGIIAAPIRHSDQLHIVERFSLDPETLALRRDYVAEDPVYFVGEYAGSDTVLVADVPYEAHPCDELAPEFRQAGAPAAESRSEQ